MRCGKCGTELERPNQGHTCRSIVPVLMEAPAGWVVLTWVVFGLAVLYLITAVGVAVVSAGLPADGDYAALPTDRLAIAVAVSAVWFVVLIGTVISQLVWNRRTRRLAEQYGFDGSIVVRHWFLRTYAATVIATVFVQPLLGLSQDQGLYLATAIRLAAGLVLVGNVLVGRARLLGLIADANRQVQQARHDEEVRPSSPGSA